jgi:PAS domain S-box-containing protein
VVDAAQIVRFASASIHRLLGRTAETVIGQPLADLLHQEDRDAATAGLLALLGGTGDTATAATRLQHANGAWRRFDWSAANLIEEPAVRGLVLNCRDVTDRTELEVQLRQAQKMEVVGQLAGGVAHDFNNLLTAVLAEAEFVLEALPAQATVRPEVENIRLAAQRGRALTSRLLSFSRPSGAEPRVVRIGDRIAEFRPLIQRLLGESHRLDVSTDGSSGAARIDPDDLEHALLNLVANARDAMPASGTVRISVTDRTLDSPLDQAVLPVLAGEYVVVEVADTGTGIDAVTKMHLFQPFFTTKGSTKGTGLGLTGVLAFARRSNGGIAVFSRPGEGARFELWFPAVSSPLDQPTPAYGTRRVTGSGTILLVEDDEGVRHAARRILAAGGYTVLEAPAADEARQISAARGGDVDLLVTDVMMPGESGAALAAGLRAERPELPVLFISGYPGEDLARLGLRFGDLELLRKPFTARELTERVRAVMDARGVRV